MKFSFGQLISAIGIFNSVFVVFFGLLYINGGYVTRDYFMSAFIILFGLTYVIGFFVLYRQRKNANKKAIKEVK